MGENSLQEQLTKALETIETLQNELTETNSGLIALTLELEQRVDERTAELRTRCYQQEVIAQLGQQALTVSEINILMNEAVQALTLTLGVECCLIFKLNLQDNVLECMAGESSKRITSGEKRIVEKINSYV